MLLQYACSINNNTKSLIAFSQYKKGHNDREQINWYLYNRILLCDGAYESINIVSKAIFTFKEIYINFYEQSTPV